MLDTCYSPGSDADMLCPSLENPNFLGIRVQQSVNLLRLIGSPQSRGIIKFFLQFHILFTPKTTQMRSFGDGNYANKHFNKYYLVTQTPEAPKDANRMSGRLEKSIPPGETLPNPVHPKSLFPLSEPQMFFF